MKKRSSWIVITLVLMLLLSACGENTSGNKASSSSNTGNANTSNVGGTTDTETEKPVELTMTYMVFNIPKDIDLIEAELSKLTKEKINATVDLVPIQLGSYNQQMNLMMTSREKMDLVMTGNLGNILTYSQQVPKGQLLPIDDLLKEHGQGILDALGDYAYTAKIDGQVYGVTTNRDLAGAEGWAIRKDIAEKYNIDLTSINSLNDVEKALEVIKAGGETVYPFGIGNGRTLVAGAPPENIDPLGDFFGVVRKDDTEMKVVNFYETEEYNDLVYQAREWFEKGLIPKDIATVTDSSETLMKAGKILSFVDTVRPGASERMSGLVGTPVEMIPLVESKADTTNVTKFMWAIAAHSEHPEKAMQLMNLMYSDKEVFNLLAWGIEGTHYEKIDDTFIKYPEGQDSSNSGYALNMEFAMGNMFLSYVWEGSDPTLWDRMIEYNQNANKSPALGFLWDSSPVKNELAAVVNVRDQYVKALENGLVDPADLLPEFIDKLKSAGIDKIIEEKQKQLDAWKASK